MDKNTIAKITLAASILVAIAGQATAFPAGWNQIISVLGAIGATLSAWAHQQQPEPSMSVALPVKEN